MEITSSLSTTTFVVIIINNKTWATAIYIRGQTIKILQGILRCMHFNRVSKHWWYLINMLCNAIWWNFTAKSNQSSVHAKQCLYLQSTKNMPFTNLLAAHVELLLQICHPHFLLGHNEPQNSDYFLLKPPPCQALTNFAILLGWNEDTAS